MAEVTITVQDDQGQGMNMILYDDQQVPGPLFKQIDIVSKLADIKNIDYRDGDVFIITYPKTGTHWASNLVNCILTPGSVKDIPSVSPLIVELFRTEMVNSKPSPRVLVSHKKFNRLPREHIQKKGKLVFVARNPKDTAVSMFHHSRKDNVIINNMQSWSSFVTCFLAGFVPSGSYFDYLASWQAAIEDNKDLDILIVYYEDLKKNGLSELRRISNFLEANNTNDRIQEIIDHCSLQTLKSDVDSGKTKFPLVDQEGKSVVYRKGEIADWKNHFTVAENELFDRISAEKLRKSIFSFQYE